MQLFVPFKGAVRSNRDCTAEKVLMIFSKSQQPGLNLEVGQQSRRHMLLGNQFHWKQVLIYLSRK